MEDRPAMLSCKNPAFVLLASLAFTLDMSSPAAAQHFSVGMKAGVATLEPVSAVGIFDRQLHPLVFGPVIEGGLPRDLSVEISALHRHITLHLWYQSARRADVKG